MKISMNMFVVAAIIAIFLIMAFLLHSFVFSIYEVTLSPVKNEIKIDDTITISANAVNGLGFRPPFRDAPFTYEIREGLGLLKIEKDESFTGSLSLKFTSPGEIKILVTPKHALKPTLFEFTVKP